MAKKGVNFSKAPKPSGGIGKVLILGHLAINLPALIIMFGFFLGGRVVFGLKNSLIYLTAGFILAWLWWSFMTPRWREWALRSGAPADKLQKWAVATGLTWPKGWVFEKTEFPVTQVQKEKPFKK